MPSSRNYSAVTSSQGVTELVWDHGAWTTCAALSAGSWVLPYSAVVEAWAPLHAKLFGQLHRGGANDLWTAACALVQVPPLPVVTNNLSDFRAVAAVRPELQLVHPDV